MTGVSNEDWPQALCLDCGYRYEPGDQERCELNQLRDASRGDGSAALEDDLYHDSEEV